jgi:hypothetical protein
MTNTASGYRTPASRFDLPPVIASASEAIQGPGNTARRTLDCFVALLLAMTMLKHRASRFRMFANVIRSQRDALCDCMTGKSRGFRENLSSLTCKNKSLRVDPKSNLKLSPSRCHMRGASRSSRTLEAGCDGRGSVKAPSWRGRMKLQRTAKSCGPGAPTLALSSRDDTCGRRWQQSPVTGEITYKPLKPLCRECRLMRCTPGC